MGRLMVLLVVMAVSSHLKDTKMFMSSEHYGKPVNDESHDEQNDEVSLQEDECVLGQ